MRRPVRSRPLPPALRIVLLSALAWTLAGGALRADFPARTDRVLVRVAPGERFATLLPVGSRHLFAGWWRIPVERGVALEAARARWRAVAGVDRVEPDAIQRLGGGSLPEAAHPSPPIPVETSAWVPNDPLLAQQWHMLKVQAEEAWGLSRGDGVLVAIADSGVATGGEDFQCAPLAGEYDAVADVEGPGVAVDRLGHGTFVAGVIAECTDNGLGVVGLAPGARILAIRACTDDAECASSDVAASIDWAREHGARVINLSLGMACGTLDWPACSTEIENDAIARAKAAGMVIVAIAGNGGEDHIGFPANHPDVIGVGGVEERLLITSYSSWGTALSLMAPAGEPGVDRDHDGFADEILEETLGRICNVFQHYQYCRWSGTSFAAPHVVATVALLLARHPEATRDQVRRALVESALDEGAPGFDPVYGYGVLQAATALARLDAIVAETPPLCTPSETRLCLGSGRFGVEVAWRDFQGNTGSGHALPMTDDSGLLWFFAPTNLEMLVKALDGCGTNGHHWLFAAATTDVEWHLTVTDGLTGATKVYDNPLGRASPATTDTSAFLCP